MESKEGKRLIMKGFKIIKEVDEEFKKQEGNVDREFKKMFGVNRKDFKDLLKKRYYRYKESKINVVPLGGVITDVLSVHSKYKDFDSLVISCTVTDDCKLKSVRICFMDNKKFKFTSQTIDIYGSKYYGTLFYFVGREKKKQSIKIDPQLSSIFVLV